MAALGKKCNFLNLIAVAVLLVVGSCKQPAQESTETKQETPATVNIPVPAFNADSALHYLQTQVAFGPRVPGTDAHAQCADYLFQKLKSFGLQTQIQSETITTFDSKKFRLKNVIAEYKPEAKQRVLLLAHWDTRPWADHDSVRKDQPFDGANDGASGVAVLLEIARLLPASGLETGIDILLVDLKITDRKKTTHVFLGKKILGA
ncbi:MAG: M28 family peptidase [Bacteroidota bacterium]|nr:MAG: M28 family peptidase [Bacteroidota bacterium]